jgi:type II secretion system protein L
MSRKILGIDIRSDSIAAVLVTSSMRENRIDAATVVPIPEASEERPNGIAAALESLKNTVNISECDCVISVPSEKFSYRNIQVPFSNPKKIRMVLPFELEPTLPYPIDDLVLDFQIIDTAESEGTTPLIAAAIAQSDLDPYNQALSAMKIDPECLTISGLPAALCLGNHDEAQEDQFFVAVNKKSCTLYATAGGQIQVIRSFVLPQLESSRPDTIISQIKRTLAAFDEMELYDFRPHEITISGEGLDIESLTEDVAGALNTEVKTADLATRLEIPIAEDMADSWKPAQMDDALALALMEIENLDGLNFHLGQFAVQKFLAKNKPQVIKTAILAAAILALLIFNVAVDFYSVHRRIETLNNQMQEVYKATFPEIKTIRYPYEDMEAKITDARRKSVFVGDTGPHIRSIDILNNISRRIPKDIKLDMTRLVVGSGNVLISGNTDEFDSLDAIKDRLEQIDFFKKVSISSSNRDRSGKEIRFVLKAEL